MIDMGRRAFLAASASGLGLGTMLNGLRPLTAEELKMGNGIARFSNDIEPLVRFLEETPRDSVIQQTARRVQDGLSYRELLAALLLAGVRNVQPRPSVGFKFHAVLVVNSAHLASLGSAGSDRWLPIFWAIDNFKSSQARDVREGNWTLPAVEESSVPPPHRAASELRRALDRWDEAGADAAVTSLVRHSGANRVFEELSAYAARDFRSIGHKVIYLSNGFRTLQTIGWEYAEPVMRSLVYAMLNHVGDPNPADSDLVADRPGRTNRELLKKIPDHWRGGKLDDDATRELVRSLHQDSYEQTSEKVVEMIDSGIGLQSIWDGLFASAGELLMRQRGIVSLHAVTTTNAIFRAFQMAADEETQKYLLLQNAAFLPMFRDAARNRGAVADIHIDEMESESGSADANQVPAIFEQMGESRAKGAHAMYGYLDAGGDPRLVADHARRLVFLKGNDSHDYKFSSAALEDYRVLTKPWRDRFIAASTYQLPAASDRTQPLTERIQEALG